MKRKERYLALGIAFLLIFSVSSVLAPATARSNQISFNFSFANKWGTYQATGYYVAGTKNAPVVLFLHGLDANKNWYKWMIDPYLKAGYVLVMFNIPSKWAMQGLLSSFNISNKPSNQPELGPYVDGFSACIDSLSNLNGVIDLNLIAATGHSAGGLGAMAAAAQDSRIKAVVALSPPVQVSGLLHSLPTEFKIPIQLQVGSNEGELYNGVKNYYSQLQASVKQLVVIQGGNHIQFMDADIVLLINLLGKSIQIPYVGNQPSGISTQRQHEISSQAFLSFLNEYFHA
jgi:predicted dienelactone hydrolase